MKLCYGRFRSDIRERWLGTRTVPQRNGHRTSLTELKKILLGGLRNME